MVTGDAAPAPLHDSVTVTQWKSKSKLNMKLWLPARIEAKISEGSVPLGQPVLRLCKAAFHIHVLTASKLHVKNAHSYRRLSIGIPDHFTTGPNITDGAYRRQWLPHLNTRFDRWHHLLYEGKEVQLEWITLIFREHSRTLFRMINCSPVGPGCDIRILALTTFMRR